MKQTTNNQRRIAKQHTRAIMRSLHHLSTCRLTEFYIEQCIKTIMDETCETERILRLQHWDPVDFKFESEDG